MSIKPLTGADALTLHQMSEPASDSIRMSKDQMEAAKAFEAYMVEMMVKEMRKTIPDGMFSGESTEIFSGLFDQEISKRIAETGGFGFDEVMGQALNGDRIAPQPASYMPMVMPSAGNPVHGAHDHHRHHHDHDHGDLPVEGVITSRFGRRSDPFRQGPSPQGLDIAAPTGTPFIRSVQARWFHRAIVAATETSWSWTTGTAPRASMLTATSRRSRRETRSAMATSLRPWARPGAPRTSPPPGGASRWQGRRSDGRIEAIASKHRPLGQQDGPEMKFLLQEFVQPTEEGMRRKGS